MVASLRAGMVECVCPFFFFFSLWLYSSVLSVYFSPFYLFTSCFSFISTPPAFHVYRLSFFILMVSSLILFFHFSAWLRLCHPPPSCLPSPPSFAQEPPEKSLEIHSFHFPPVTGDQSLNLSNPRITQELTVTAWQCRWACTSPFHAPERGRTAPIYIPGASESTFQAVH